MPGVDVLRYTAPPKPQGAMSLSQQLCSDALARADAVAHHCEQLRQRGWVPDRTLLIQAGVNPWGCPKSFLMCLDCLARVMGEAEHGGHGSDPELLRPACPSVLSN